MNVVVEKIILFIVLRNLFLFENCFFTTEYVTAFRNNVDNLTLYYFCADVV